MHLFLLLFSSLSSSSVPFSSFLAFFFGEPFFGDGAARFVAVFLLGDVEREVLFLPLFKNLSASATTLSIVPSLFNGDGDPLLLVFLLVGVDFFVPFLGGIFVLGIGTEKKGEKDVECVRLVGL